MEPTLFSATRSIVERMYPEASPNFFPEQYKGEFNLAGRHTEVRVDVQKHIVVIYSNVPGFTITGKDPTKRLVRFMARVNEMLYFGNLEYNFETGEVRYKTSQIFQGIANPENSIRFLLEQHKENFPKLAEGLDELLRNTQADPVTIANAKFPPT